MICYTFLSFLSLLSLCPAQVTLKLFKAEDIPRMDSNTMEKMKNFFVGGTKKEHVDPYFTFSFAGKEVSLGDLLVRDNRSMVLKVWGARERLPVTGISHSTLFCIYMITIV